MIRKRLSREEVLADLTGRHLRGKPLLATVSGVATTKTALIAYADEQMPFVGVITTKSFQVRPNSGNREPIITETELGSFGNSVGLRNPGMEAAFAELAQLRSGQELRALLNVSVSGSTPEEFIALVEKFAPVADLIELNFSCPHAAEGYGASIGCDPMIAAEYMRAVREAVGDDCPALIFPKLTPNVADIGVIARAVQAAGADGISAVNTYGPRQYIEPHAGRPILQNDLDGRGGMSGLWIREDALEAVRAIREAVGPDLPVIGMGGVSSGADAAAMVSAGADVVGMGSVFGRIHQGSWGPFTEAVHADMGRLLAGSEDSGDTSSHLLMTERRMAYHPCTITKIDRHASGVVVIYTDMQDESLRFGPGEYAFIWIPGVGEKPFSAAHSDPLTFIIKDRGPFTHALAACEEGDTIYVRGVYGAQVEPEYSERAVIIAGGTGLAVVPSLAEKLQTAGTKMDIYYGTSAVGEEAGRAPLEERISAYGEMRVVADEGIPGRVLDVMDRELDAAGDLCCYMIGPEIFMSRAAGLLERRGVPARKIFLSMERPTLCGIGMCGECLCGDRLTCQWGTFMRLDFLKEHAPEVLV